MDIRAASIFYIGYLVPFSVVVPLFMSWRRYAKLSGEFRVLSWFLVFNLVSSLVVVSMASRGIPNMPVMHFYTFFEFLFLALFFREVFTNTIVKRLIEISALLFTIFFVLDVRYWEDLSQFNNYSKSVEAFFMTVFSFIYFIFSLEDNREQAKAKVPVTLMVAGLLIYFSASLALFMVLNINPRYIKTQIIIWDIHATLLLLMFILFSVGLWKKYG